MKITVTSFNDEFLNFEVSGDMELENFKALCAQEFNISSSQLQLQYNGVVLLNDKSSLKSFGIIDGDVLLMKPVAPSRPPGSTLQNVPVIDFGSLDIPSTSQPLRLTQEQYMNNPETIRNLLKHRPHDLSLVKERNPELADAIDDKDKFREIFMRQQEIRKQTEKQRLDLLQRDQFDPEVQKLIAEEIRMKNVDSNMETAMEYSPESFGQVVMLYINCKVNGHCVKAFVDSGAQMTIMSAECADRCHIKHLIDTRWSGWAHGVGTQKILGRVHLGQIQIGDTYLPSSFSILEQQPMDMLLGLDMLRRHQCCIDLKANKLIIGTTKTETSFLPESEIPPSARISNVAQSTDSDRQLAEALAQSAKDAGL